MSGLEWESSPSYYDLILSSSHYVRDNIRGFSNYSFSSQVSQDLVRCINNLSITNYILILTLTFFWTFARTLMTEKVFKVGSSKAIRLYSVLLIRVNHLLIFE